MHSPSDPPEGSPAPPQSPSSEPPTPASPATPEAPPLSSRYGSISSSGAAPLSASSQGTTEGLASGSVRLAEAKSANKPRYILTYTLWLFGGWFGLHRFYLRQWFGGLLYACTMGFLGIGWIVDAFLIPRMLKGKVEEDNALAKEAIEADIPIKEPIIAPWAAEGGGLLFKLQLFFGGLFLLFAPMVVVVFAVLFKQWTLLAVMVGILLFTNFLDHVRQLLEHREEQIKKLPFMKQVIKHFNGFYDFYIENRPRGFLFYLFYFPFGFLTLAFSGRSREEFKLYLRVFAAISAALIVGTLSSYKDVYGSYVPVSIMISYLIANLLILFIIVLLYMMPTMTTAFAFSLSGRRKVLMPITFVSMMLAGLVGIVGYTQERGGVTIINRSILQEKFKRKGFVQEFTVLSHMFLSYEVKRIKPQKALWSHRKELRDRFRGYAAKLAAGSQRNAFHILQFQPASGGKPWLVLALRSSRQVGLLYAMAPDGRIYRAWKTLPGQIQKAMLRQKLPPFPAHKSMDKRDRKGYLVVKPMLLMETIANIDKMKIL